MGVWFANQDGGAGWGQSRAGGTLHPLPKPSPAGAGEGVYGGPVASAVAKGFTGGSPM